MPSFTIIKESQKPVSCSIVTDFRSNVCEPDTFKKCKDSDSFYADG